MKLLAILFAFALYHFVEKPAAMKSFNWLLSLQNWIKQYINDNQGRFAFTLLLPLFVLWFLLSQVFVFADDSVLQMLLHILLVYYCLGPDTIEKMIKNKQTGEQLQLSPESTAEETVNKLTTAALHRWFGVFFWYIILNVYGALVYRMVCFLAYHHNEEQIQSVAGRMLRVIEFPVTVLMTLSLALASDFDRIWQHCKQYLHMGTIKTLNSQFMYKSMDFAVEQCEIEESDENKDQIVALTTFKVLKRMLVVWLVFSALLVIFSIG
ncbi:MAG: hypothetical protein R3E90_15605 [Marinicella sp.]|nr:hypothetical protein [Xanthomonadales bacterium]